jgi:hypothetical protein
MRIKVYIIPKETNTIASNSNSKKKEKKMIIA